MTKIIQINFIKKYNDLTIPTHWRCPWWSTICKWRAIYCHFLMVLLIRIGKNDWLRKTKSLTKIIGGREVDGGGYTTQYCSGAVGISKRGVREANKNPYEISTISISIHHKLPLNYSTVHSYTVWTEIGECKQIVKSSIWISLWFFYSTILIITSRSYLIINLLFHHS